MTEYMKKHETYVYETMKSTDQPEELLAYHHQQILFLQHERLIHLLVMIFTGTLFIVTFTGMLFYIKLPLILLVIVLFALTIAYVIHYYRLENTVQRWYKIANSLQMKMNGIGTNNL